jgi:hypothetical protein
MKENVDFDQLIKKSPNRRKFMRTLGIAGTLAGTVGALDLSAQSASMDAAILNFALNLEYLEAEFYTVTTTGKTISQIGMTVTGTGSAGATTGGNQVNFTNSVTQAVAMELANDEQTHVALIQSALTSLGGTAMLCAKRARPARCSFSLSAVLPMPHPAASSPAVSTVPSTHHPQRPLPPTAHRSPPIPIPFPSPLALIPV